MVSNISIVLMIIGMIAGFVIPVSAAIYAKKKLGCSLRMVLLGSIIFFISTVILESLVHRIILGAVPGIQNNIILFALYGGLMAGIFEETGRLLGFKYFCKGGMKNDNDAIMYGIGHGGFEMFYLFSIGMFSYIFMAIMINNGSMSSLTEGLDNAAVENVNMLAENLINTPFYNYILGLVERLSAMTIQISLSVVVWFGIKKEKYALYALAVLIHALVDSLSVIIGSFANPIVVELLIIILAIGTVYVAKYIYTKEKDNVITQS